MLSDRFDGTAVLFLLGVGLFALSAGVGVWAAYDRHAAGLKFGLILAGTAIALSSRAAARLDPGRTINALRYSCSVLIGGLAILGAVSGTDTRDAASGAIGLLIPLALGDLPGMTADLRRRAPRAALTCTAVLAGFFLITVSGESSAWASLAGAGLFAAATARPSRRGRITAATWVGAGSLTLGAATTAALVSGFFEPAVVLPSWLPCRLTERLEFWHDSATAVGDYIFTGCGLGNAPMVLSSYVWLLHVPFTEHVHNLFLQIALEQGAPGLGAFLGMLAATLWHLGRTVADSDQTSRQWNIAAGASLVGLIVYGMVESDVYASLLLPLLFVPIAAAWAGEAPPSGHDRCRISSMTAMLVASVLLAVTAGLILWPRPTSWLVANLGAVAQGRAELAVFRWPEWGIQDRLRRERIVDLRSAVEMYEAALAKNPNNVTALRRLGQIELSFGHYASALERLLHAYDLARGQRATRQLLGEAYAVTGRIDEAARLWATTGNRRGELDLREWWYGYLGNSQEQHRLRQAIQRIPKKSAQPR